MSIPRNIYLNPSEHPFKGFTFFIRHNSDKQIVQQLPMLVSTPPLALIQQQIDRISCAGR